MRRRDFIAFAAGALAWPIAARAQEVTRVHRILWLSTASGPDPFLDGFREGLRAQGYVEGKNVVLQSHYSPGNPQALRAIVSELKAGDVDLVVSSGAATRAMQVAACARIFTRFCINFTPYREANLAPDHSRPVTESLQIPVRNRHVSRRTITVPVS